VYLPLISTVQRCDSYEPNDSRAGAAPWGPLVSGQNYFAKICSGDREDNYFFVTASNRQVQITITLPDPLVNRSAMWLYQADDLRQGHEVCGAGTVSSAPFILPCSIPVPGRYILRLYTDDQGANIFDNVHDYILRVDYE